MLPAIPPKQPRMTINIVQALRAIAALLVVSTHVETAFRENAELAGIPWPSRFAGLSGFGGVGVDIFFIISGFIMVYVGVSYFRRENTIGDFLVRRVLRIYPIYWLVTLLLIGFALAKTLLEVMSGQSLAESLDFDLQWYRLLGSFSLFPTYNEFGNIQPIVGVGWTLSFEVFFYFIFAIAIAFGFRWAPLFVVAVFAFLVFAPLPVGDSALGLFLTDPILLEFPAGMLIGYAVVLGLRPPRWLLLSCITLALAGYAADIIFNFDYSYRYLSRGIPSALLVFGLIFWEIKFGFKVPPLLVKLGDASYSIYLIHTIVIGYFIIPVVRALPLLQQVQVDILGVFAFVLAAGVGVLLYEKVERPLLQLLMERYKGVSWGKTLASSKQS
jgi:exopolysaccharide production protein ExoZ